MIERYLKSDTADIVPVLVSFLGVCDTRELAEKKVMNEILGWKRQLESYDEENHEIIEKINNDQWLCGGTIFNVCVIEKINNNQWLCDGMIFNVCIFE
jgi:hypothetical protein